MQWVGHGDGDTTPELPHRLQQISATGSPLQSPLGIPGNSVLVRQGTQLQSGHAAGDVEKLL